MSSSRPLVLIIGCGSIGERHVRTFLATGRADVIACDNRPAILAQMSERYRVSTTPDWVPMLANPALTGVVIATPAPSHVEIALRCLEAGRHVLCEKPLSLSLAGTHLLLAARDRARRFAGVAYVLHFVPAVQAARQFIQAGSFGPVRHVAVNTAAHQVLEGVTVEDTVNVAARNGGTLVSYALNQFQAVNETRWDFHAETGSVRVELNAQRWGVLARGDSDWRWHPAPVTDRDQLFVAQAGAFLDAINGKPNAVCTLEEGIQTLRFNLAALQSWTENRPINP